MASKSAVGDEASKKKSIVIMDMPVEFINRDIIKTHFEQFGRVERLACSVSKKYAVVHFSTPEEAEDAAAKGTMIRADAPRLKIVTRGPPPQSTASSSTIQKPSTTAAAQQSARLVTKRKIVRNPFALPSSSNVSPSETIMEPSTNTAAGSTSATSSQLPPLRSSIKISRPSPFNKKRLSFGDRTARMTGLQSPKTSIPSRNKLSLDRRKVASVGRGKENASKTGTSDFSGERIPLTDDTVSIHTRDEPEASSSTTGLPTTDQSESKVTNFDEETEVSLAPAFANTNEITTPSMIDQDEETQDDIGNQDDNVYDLEEDNNEFIADPADPNMAEVTTEEEGEILEDDQEDEDDDGGDDDDNDEDEDEQNDEVDEPFESPLKRPQTESPSTSSFSEAPFSFKVKPSTSTTTETKTSSSFKVPFKSPFGNSATPKPFSSSSFGKLFGAAPDSSSIFSGSAGLPSSLTPTAQSKEVDKPKEKSIFSQAVESVKKEESSAAVKDKQKNLSFVSLPSGSSTFGAVVTSVPSFGAISSSSTSFSSATVNFSPSSAAPKSSTLELKPSTFGSTPKTNLTKNTGVGSVASTSSPFGLAFLKKQPLTTTSKLTTLGPIPSTSKESPSNITEPQKSSTNMPKDTPNPLLLTFFPDSSEAQELFAKRSLNVEERYRILEARDKIIRARVPKTKVTVEFATRLIGTCPDMCPEKERYMRQFQRQLVSYETLPGPEFVVDHQKAVKAYSRSSADQEEPLPHELRPGPTLDFTMHYLLRYIIPLGDNPDENLSDWYNFLWDRTRSIRKDITQQQIVDHTAVSLYEKCARFHIHCASRLCELDVHSFDPKLNDENLMKCLQSLEHLYDDLRRRGVTCPTEPEFRAYQIMMNLNEGDALYNAQQLPSWILNSVQVQMALKLHHNVYTKNFVGFFRTVEGLPYMTSCILHRYFFQLRSLGLRCFVKAHCTLPKYETAMPMSTLQRMFGYGPDQSLSFSYLCEAHGIRCDTDEGKVLLKRKMFYLPEQQSIYREAYLIDSKLRTTVEEAINGEPLPDIDFANHRPCSSFDDNGQLIAGEVVKGIGGNVRTTTTISSAQSFLPPISNSHTSQIRSAVPAPLPTAPSGPSGFRFGIFQKRKDVPSQIPAVVKPKRDIDTACQVATTKFIDESIQRDVTQFSQNQLDQAKKMQKELEKRQQREMAVSQIAGFCIEQMLSTQIGFLVRTVAESNLRKMQMVQHVSQNAVLRLLEENMFSSIYHSATTELASAKELQHRLIITASRIFTRIRARFVISKWSRFSKSRRLAREMEEERRREQLWNFPVINPFSFSTKDVFRAFCGKSSVQPSLNKVQVLSSSPENSPHIYTRPKRKSDGDASEAYNCEAPKKLRKLDSASALVMDDAASMENSKMLWEFPCVNPYRTNREVLEALCGSSSGLTSESPLPRITSSFDNTKKTLFDSPSNLTGSSGDFTFKLHKPSFINQISDELRSKTSETFADLLHDIKGFASSVKEENHKFNNLKQYMEGVELTKKSYSELNSPLCQSFMDGENSNDAHNNRDSVQDWMDITDTPILSGVFIEEDILLHQIKNFVKEVRHEKTRSWNPNTFLNDIDLNNIS